MTDLNEKIEKKHTQKIKTIYKIDKKVIKCDETEIERYKFDNIIA